MQIIAQRAFLKRNTAVNDSDLDALAERVSESVIISQSNYQLTKVESLPFDQNPPAEYLPSSQEEQSPTAKECFEYHCRYLV